MIAFCLREAAQGHNCQGTKKETHKGLKGGEKVRKREREARGENKQSKDQRAHSPPHAATAAVLVLSSAPKRGCSRPPRKEEVSEPKHQQKKDRTATHLGPDLEQRVPRARAQGLAVVGDAQARYAVVVAKQLVHHLADLCVPDVAVVVVVAGEEELAGA